MISFIVATYNRPKNLKVLLDCLIAQDNDDWECLVMDEGDNRHIIPNDARFKYHPITRVMPFPNEPRGSFGLLPKQHGIQYALGDWVCFPCDDVYYVPQFVSIMANATKNPSDIIACDFVYDRNDYNVPKTHPKVGGISSCNYIIKKDCIGNTKFSEFFSDIAHMGIADGLFIEKLVAGGASFQRIPKALMVYN